MSLSRRDRFFPEEIAPVSNWWVTEPVLMLSKSEKYFANALN
jgi:hypothetical protein